VDEEELDLFEVQKLAVKRGIVNNEGRVSPLEVGDEVTKLLSVDVVCAWGELQRINRSDLLVFFALAIAIKICCHTLEKE
jgi:hypothetical protein